MLTPAAAEQREGVVMLDGSLVTIIATGDRLEVFYIDPPPMVREAGAKKGSPILTGDWDQGILVGEAYVYAPLCPTIAYPIRGVVNAMDYLIVIGPTPKLREGSCEVAGYEWNEHSVLKLGSPMTTQKSKQAKPKKAKPKKPKPKPQRSAPRPRQPQQQNWWWSW